MHAVGVDIGGTKIAVGVVDEHGQIVETVKRPTEPQRPESIDAAIADAVNELATRFEIEAVGLAAAGFMAADRRVATFGPNIAWRNYPLAERVGALLTVAVPVVVENDANAAGWAEFAHGAAQGKPNMTMLTIGTGLGGALVVDGRLVRGAYGFGAEIGHIAMVPGGDLCGCGHHGCWEQYASGSALVRWARQAAVEDPQRAVTLLELAGGDPEKIKGHDVTAAAFDGDELAVALLARLGEWIGRGCANLASTLDPEIFVVGGGVIAAGDFVLGPARAAYEAALPVINLRPVAPIVAAHMGNDAGMVGAAALAREAIASGR